MFAVPPAAIAWYGFVQQIIFGVPFGQNPAPDWSMWLMLIPIGIGLPVLFALVQMTTEVHDDHILVEYRPFARREFARDDIKGAEVRTYRPIAEYGGWGIRVWFGGKRAYSAYGNQGVELTLADGARVMLGSQKPDDLLQAIGR